MEEVSTQCSDPLRIALLVSEQAHQRVGEGNQHQQLRMPEEYCGDLIDINNVKSSDDDTGAVLPQASQAHAANIKIRTKDEDMLPQSVSLPAAVAAESDAYVEKDIQAPRMEEEEEQDDKQHNHARNLHGREPILLWNVKKGLAPIAAAAVDGCNTGVSALATPSSGGAGSLTKVAATLEEETPRTSIPSLEVSPMNNFYAWRNCASSCAPSTSTTLNSTSCSSTPSPSRGGGADDADGSDGCCFHTVAAHSPAEILAAAATAAASRTAEADDEPTAGTTSNTQSPASTLTSAQTVSVDPANESAVESATSSRPPAGVDETAALGDDASASVLQLFSTSGDAAAVLSSPAALSLLATPCPVGAADFHETVQSTSTTQGPASNVLTPLELPRTEDSAAVVSVNPDITADAGIDIVATAESGGRDRSVIQVQRAENDTAAQRCTAVVVQTFASDWQSQKERPQRLLLAGCSGVSALDIGAAEFSSNTKEDWHSFSAGSSDTDLMTVTRESEVVAAEKNLVAARGKETGANATERNAPTVAESATVSEETDQVSVGDPPSCAARVSGNAGRRAGPRLRWVNTSRPDLDVGEGSTAAPSTASPSETSSKILCPEQKQFCQAEQEDQLDALRHASAVVAPLSATSCCTDLSTSPFAAAFKGDTSPVSCGSSSSTASVTSPASSPLSSATCGGNLTTDATASTARAAAGDGSPEGTQDSGAAASLESTADGEEGRGNGNGKTTGATPASSSSGETRDNNTPTWYVGFRLPLGAEGRQVLLRRLRRAYHAAPPATRDAVLASHGLYFSRVPFATVSDLFKLSHLLGVFDFAVQCSHEFGGSGGGGGSAAGGAGGAHGNKRSNHHPRNVNRSSHGNQRQLCSGAGNAGAEMKVRKSCADATAELPTRSNGAVQWGMESAVAAAASSQRKSAGGVASRAGVAAASGAYGGTRKGGNGKAPEQACVGEVGIASRSIDEGRAATATANVEGDLSVSPGSAREAEGAEVDAWTINNAAEIHTVLKETAVGRSRLPQRKRSAAGRSSVCRGAGRQQQSQQHQENQWEEMEALSRAHVTGGCNDRIENSFCGESQDSQTQQHTLLQQLLQAGVGDQTRSVDGRTEGKSMLADILALLAGEGGKADSAPVVPLAVGGSRATHEHQQQRQRDEQLPLPQLQEHAKTADTSCRGEGSTTNDSPLDSRKDPGMEQEQRQELALQRLLSEAVRGAGIGGPQRQPQQHVIPGGGESPNGGRVGCKRNYPSADAGRQHEQWPWSSRFPSAGAAGGENAWEKRPHEAAQWAQPHSAAELLSFLTSGADQRCGNDCYGPSLEVTAVKPPPYMGISREGKKQSAQERNEFRNNSGSLAASSFDWKETLMENLWSSVRELHRPNQVKSDARMYTTAGPSTAAVAHTDVLHTANCAPAVSPRDRSHPEEILQEEEIIRRRKRLRTTRYPAAAVWNTGASPLETSPRCSAAAAAVSAPGICTGPAATVTRAGPTGRDGCPHRYTSEEEALLSALISMGGSSPGDQQNRRWTLNTVAEIIRLLLQLNNSSSGSVAEEKEAHRANLVQCTEHLYRKDSFHEGGGCKHSSCSTSSRCSSNPFCSRLAINSSYCSSNTTSCSGTGEDGYSFGGNTVGRHSPPFRDDTRPGESMCTSTSLTGAPVDGAARPYQRVHTNVSCACASQPERQNVLAHEQHASCGVPSFPSAISPAVEQLQEELSRRSGPPPELSGSQNGCSKVANSISTDSYSENPGQAGSSSNSRRDACTDVFSQLTSQLQLLSTQVFHQHEPDSTQHHFSHERVSNQQQYDPRIQAQQVYETLREQVNVPSALTRAAPAAAHGDPGASASGRLCSPEKATEYAASVQALQAAELVELQQRIGKLLSFCSKTQAAGSSLSDISALLAAASPSAPSPTVTTVPTPAGTAVAAVAVSAAKAAGSAKSAPAAVEPSSSVVAARASSLLEGKTGSALLDSIKEASASALLGLAFKHTDLINLLKERDSSQPSQQLKNMHAPMQQEEQDVPLPQRSPSSRGSNSKMNSSKGSTGRTSKGVGARNSGRTRHNQTGEKECFSAKTQPADSSTGAAADSGLVRGRKERNASERTGGLLKQQETPATNNYVAHSNSFSTCCSDDFAELYTSGSSSSTMDSNHGSSGHVCGRGCDTRATLEKAYTHNSYSCNNGTRDDGGICLQ